MLEGKALRAGCIRYWTCRRIGRIPKTTRRSNRDWDRPALAAFLHITTGPSWQWSPTRINCKKRTGRLNEIKRWLEMEMTVYVCSWSSYLLGSEDNGHHALWFSGLGALINQDWSELHLSQTRIPCSNTGAADHIGILTDGKGIKQMLDNSEKPWLWHKHFFSQWLSMGWHKI